MADSLLFENKPEATEMPAVLVELGFMQDAGDNALFDQNLNAYADAIADAVAGVIRR